MTCFISINLLTCISQKTVKVTMLQGYSMSNVPKNYYIYMFFFNWRKLFFFKHDFHLVSCDRYELYQVKFNTIFLYQSTTITNIRNKKNYFAGDESFWPFSNILYNLGTAFYRIGPYLTILDHTKPFLTILIYERPLWTIFEQFCWVGPFWIVLDHFKQF